MVALVDLMDTLSAVVPFGDHVHLHLSGTDAVALTDHITEGTIAAIAGVGRDEEVTEVDGLRDVTTDEVYGTDEVAHLRDSIRYQHGLEVISLIHPMTDTSGDSIDILQHRCVLDTDDVTADSAVDVVVAEDLFAQHLGLSHIEAADRQVGHAVLGDLFGVTRACDNPDLTRTQLLILL